MIKIPTTSAGVNAAKNVLPEGIKSLGTALFSVPQAIAASQAEMLAISPYFNGASDICAVLHILKLRGCLCRDSGTR